MRLSNFEIEAVKKCSSDIFGKDINTYLFGSRVDDSKRGGDIDLLINGVDFMDANELLLKKLDFLSKLKKLIGDRKIDVVISKKQDDRLIVQTAINKGILL